MNYILPLLFISSLLASSIRNEQLDHKCGAHTWSAVGAYDNIWKGQLAPIFEDSWFVDENCTKFNTFDISQWGLVTFGFKFGNDVNFNMAYTLTLVEDTGMREMVTKACIYIITATSPAHPDIRIESYNNATCGHIQRSDGSFFYVE